MSEEAIKTLKEMQKICKLKTYIENEERSEWQREYKAIDTILNLIDKLQKENEDMREELQMYVDTDIMKLREENEALKETIDELAKENEKWIDSGLDYVKRHFKDYIHKDRIRAKIKELIKEGNYRTLDNPTGRVHFHKEDVDYKIEVLNELLGDE